MYCMVIYKALHVPKLSFHKKHNLQKTFRQVAVRPNGENVLYSPGRKRSSDMLKTAITHVRTHTITFVCIKQNSVLYPPFICHTGALEIN